MSVAHGSLKGDMLFLDDLFAHLFEFTGCLGRRVGDLDVEGLGMGAYLFLFVGGPTEK